MGTLHVSSISVATILRAVRRARNSILAVAGVYVLSILVGIVMVHIGNTFALQYRDRSVNQVTQQDPTAQATNQGNNFQAALLDFSSNLFIGAVPKTMMGVGVVFPFPFIAYQGWVGGIVSVRGDHTSRFNDPRSVIYYLLTLFLQVVPYSLAVGAGVNVGVALFRPSENYRGQKWLNFFPKEALADMGRIYILVIPLFLIASLWEFLSIWNI